MTIVVAVAVVIVGMAVVVTMTAIADLLATMIVIGVPMDVAMIMALEALIGMRQADATIVTATVVTTTVVAVTPMLAETADAMAMRLSETHGTHTVEVETKTTVLTIGTPVDKLRSANPLRCGALCQIMRPNLLRGSEGSRLYVSVHGEDVTCGFLLLCSRVTAGPVGAFSMALLPAL